MSNISSLVKGLAVLSTFAPENSDLTLSEVAKENGITLGTAHRYLSTLKDVGYVIQNPHTKKYSLTPKVLTLGFPVLKSMPLKSRILPYMEQFTQDYNVTTQCSILGGTEIIFIERVTARELVNYNWTTGSRLPVYCTSMGKVILAYLPEKETQKLITQIRFEKHTPNTIINEKDLLKELNLIRKRGYAVNDQELTLGMRALAVPIFQVDGKVEAAFGILFPKYRTEGNNLETTYVERILQISKESSFQKFS